MLGTVIFILSLIVIGFSAYMILDVYRILKRNDKVYDFEMKLLEIGGYYYMRHALAGDPDALNVYDRFVNKWSYNDLLNSRKPLELEVWYSKEELDKIKS